MAKDKTTAVFKVALLGGAKVGKTKLVARYFNDQYEETPYASTLAVQMEHQLIGETKLYVWDLSGEKRFQSLSEALLKNSNVVLILFDPTNRESFEQVKFHLAHKEEVAPGALAIIVSTKADLPKTDSVVSTAEIAQLQSEYEYFEISAKTGAGVKELFEVFTADLQPVVDPLDPTIQPAEPLMPQAMAILLITLGVGWLGFCLGAEIGIAVGAWSSFGSALSAFVGITASTAAAPMIGLLVATTVVGLVVGGIVAYLSFRDSSEQAGEVNASL